MTEEERLAEEYNERKLKEELERYEAQNQEAYKKSQDPKDPNVLEEELKNQNKPDGGDIAKGVSFEIAAGLATDKFTAGLLNPLLGPKGVALYGLANFVSGSVANLIAQRLRGDTSINLGEILSSGAAGVIPGTSLKAGKGLSKIVGKAGSVKRAAISGGLTGVGAEQIRVGIDEGRFLTAQEALLGGALGGTASAGMQKLFDAGTVGLRNYANHLKPIEAYAMTPQQAALGAVPDPFKKGTPISQQFGPYPQLPVNAQINNAVDIDSAKDDIIAIFGGKKTIRTPQGKGPLIYTLDDGANVMFEVDLRGESGILRRDQLIAVPATEVALDSRKVLESIPEDLEFWISNKYGPEYLEQYKTWVKGGRDRLVDIKKEMQESILSMRAKEVEKQIKTSYPPGDPRIAQNLSRFDTPENRRLIKLDEAKLEDSHILSIGTKGKLTRVGLTEGVDRALKGSAVAGKKTPNVTRNFPKGSRVYDAPAAYQSFIEYWRLNRARGAGIALDNVPEEEAIAQLRELGLPTSWLEDFINFALLDIGIRKELTNKDVVKLLKQGYSAEAVIEQRLRKLAREKAKLDITDFAYKVQDLTPEDAIKAIDERYEREILAGTRPGEAFLDPPE